MKSCICSAPVAATDARFAKKERSKAASIVSLVSKPALFSAVGTGPGNSVTGHAPHVFLHTVGTYLKAAATDPAEGEFPAA